MHEKKKTSLHIKNKRKEKENKTKLHVDCCTAVKGRGNRQIQQLPLEKKKEIKNVSYSETL